MNRVGQDSAGRIIKLYKISLPLFNVIWLLKLCQTLFDFVELCLTLLSFFHFVKKILTSFHLRSYAQILRLLDENWTKIVLNPNFLWITTCFGQGGLALCHPGFGYW